MIKNKPLTYTNLVMKKSRIFLGILALLVMPFVFISCEDETVEVIVPSIQVGQTDFNVDFPAGQVDVDVTSNVIFYASVDKSSESWLSYKFSGNCTELALIYAENDTTTSRTGSVSIAKGDTTIVLTVIQAGNPNANAGKLQKIDLTYAVATQGGFTVLQAAATESAKIPIGSIVVVETKEDVGTVSFLNPATYSEYAGGAPQNKKFMFVWTHEMLNTTNGKGLMGILRNGMEVTSLYCLFARTELEFTVGTQGGFTILQVAAAISDKIPVGARIILECAEDVGTVSFLNPSTYAEYAGGAPVNKRFTFAKTSEIANITNGKGLMAILRGGIQVNKMYFIYTKIDLEFTAATQGGFNILQATAEQSAKIPQGATVVFECPSNSGTISLLNPATYAEYAGGAPVNGAFTVVWTKDMQTVTTGKGIMGIMRSGFETTAMYCHN